MKGKYGEKKEVRSSFHSAEAAVLGIDGWPVWGGK